MSVLLKYQLKALFESGDLMTQDSLVDLIDSTYNPVLVAGTGVTLNTVTTPSGSLSNILPKAPEIIKISAILLTSTSSFLYIEYK